MTMMTNILSLLLMLITFVVASGIQIHRFTPQFNKNNKNEMGFKANLVRHHHTAAAAAAAGEHNLTRQQRFYEVVKRSKARAAALSSYNRITSSHSSFTTKTTAATAAATTAADDYKSTVASANGAYTMEIMLGTPPQKFSTIVDTGSDLVWIQCKPCTSCYTQSDALFDPSKSSSFMKTSCTTPACTSLPANGCSTKSKSCIYGYQYGDSSSTQGDFALETISLAATDGSNKGFPKFQFGCGRLNSGSFGSAAGIVGLGQGSISLTKQLGSAIGNRFSYCLVDFDADASITSPIYFGSAAKIAEKGVKSTPILSHPTQSTYYFVGLEGISVGGNLLSLKTEKISYGELAENNTLSSSTLEVNSGGTIIDSGTTLTLFTDSVYEKISKAFSSVITLSTVDGSSAGFDLCYDISKNKNYKFPSLVLSFKGTTFTPPQANYFVVVDTAGTISCLAMGSSGSLGVGIIGNLMQQNHHVLYDLSTGQLSFAPAQCTSL